MIFFVIVVAIIVVYLIAKQNNVDELLYSDICKEVVDCISTLRDFHFSDNRWMESTDLLMIIPTDADGNLYSNNCDRLKIHLLTHEDDDFWFQYDSNAVKLQARYRLTKEDSITSYSLIGYTIWTFNHKGREFISYKKFMSILNRYVQAHFPNAEFEFDGSRIITYLSRWNQD